MPCAVLARCLPTARHRQPRSGWFPLLACNRPSRLVPAGAGLWIFAVSASTAHASNRPGSGRPEQTGAGMLGAAIARIGGTSARPWVGGEERRPRGWALLRLRWRSLCRRRRRRTRGSQRAILHRRPACWPRRWWRRGSTRRRRGLLPSCVHPLLWPPRLHLHGSQSRRGGFLISNGWWRRDISRNRPLLQARESRDGRRASRRPWRLGARVGVERPW